MSDLDLLETNHGDMWICSMMDVCIYCLLLLPVFLCEAEVYVKELPDLIIFESQSVIYDNHVLSLDQLYLCCLPVALRGLKCVICS